MPVLVISFRPLYHHCATASVVEPKELPQNVKSNSAPLAPPLPHGSAELLEIGENVKLVELFHAFIASMNAASQL